MTWTYTRIVPTARPTALRFDVDHPDLAYEEPSGFEERCTGNAAEWRLAEREVAGVIAAGSRRGGWFAFPDGAGAASDALMDIYEVLGRNEAEAARLCRERVRDVPEELDAWCTLSNLLYAWGDAPAALRTALNGVMVGESALPDDYGGVAIYGAVPNRPFLRCLLVAGRAAIKIGQTHLAERLFTSMLWLDGHDAIGARFALHDLRAGGHHLDDSAASDTLQWDPRLADIAMPTLDYGREREERRAAADQQARNAAELDASILQALRDAGTELDCHQLAGRLGDVTPQQIAGRLRSLRSRGRTSSRAPTEPDDKFLRWSVAEGDDA
jgi:hypothetical protein